MYTCKKLHLISIPVANVRYICSLQTILATGTSSGFILEGTLRSSSSGSYCPWLPSGWPTASSLYPASNVSVNANGPGAANQTEFDKLFPLIDFIRTLHQLKGPLEATVITPRNPANLKNFVDLLFTQVKMFATVNQRQKTLLLRRISTLYHQVAGIPAGEDNHMMKNHTTRFYLRPLELLPP